MNKITILIIDKDKQNRELVHSILTSENYRTILTEETTDAFALIETDKIDLVLTSLYMEVIGFLRELKKIKITLPIVLMGCDDNEIEKQAMDEGVAGFLSFPIKRDMLIALVKVIIYGPNPLYFRKKSSPPGNN